MLSRVKTLEGYTLESLNGKIGKVKEFYFDDRHWKIRYLVADTGDWLTERQVLISPYALVNVKMEEQLIAVNLTKKQIEDSLPWAVTSPFRFNSKWIITDITAGRHIGTAPISGVLLLILCLTV